MPMLYGEGTRAFIRLQEEIIKSTDDHSIFAWRDANVTSDHGLLADHPNAFIDSGMFFPVHGGQSRKPFSMTNMGLQIQLKLYHDDLHQATILQSSSQGSYTEPVIEPTFIASLACSDPHGPMNSAIRLRAVPGTANQWTRVECSALYGYDPRSSFNLLEEALYVPQKPPPIQHPSASPAFQLVFVRSWPRREMNGEFYIAKDSGTIAQFSSHLLQTRQEIYERETWPVEGPHWIFVVGEQRHKFYGWVTFQRASDAQTFTIAVGRLLNGDLGFAVYRAGANEPFTPLLGFGDELYPAQAWMDIPIMGDAGIYHGTSPEQARVKLMPYDAGDTFLADIQFSYLHGNPDIGIQTN